MYFINEIFVKHRLHYVGLFMIMPEIVKEIIFPFHSSYNNVHKEVQQQLAFTTSKSQQELKKITLTDLSEEDLNRLKTNTKEKVKEIQYLSKIQNKSYYYSGLMLGLGSLNIFFNPFLYGLLCTSWMVLLGLDHINSVKVIKKGGEHLWSWRINDVGYIYGIGMIGLTSFYGFKHFKGVVMRRMTTKQIVVREENLPPKNQ